MTRMIRSRSARKHAQRVAHQRDLVGVRRSKVALDLPGIGPSAEHQLAHVVAPEHDIEQARGLRAVLLAARAEASSSGDVSAVASAPSCASSSRFCR